MRGLLKELAEWNRGGWPSRTLTRNGMPHPWHFTGGLRRTHPGMFTGHSEIVAFLLYTFRCRQTCTATTG